MDRIQSEKEAKEVIIWLSKSKHKQNTSRVLLHLQCYHIVFTYRVCIQTNNILFVAMVVNYLNIVFASNKKSCPTNDCRAAFLLFVI